MEVWLGSNVELLYFCDDRLCVFERLDETSALVAMLDDHRVFDEQLFQVTSFVYLRNELALGDLATLVDQEGHDCFGHEVTDVLFHNAEVAVNQVLNHSRFHDHSSALLALARPHHAGNVVQDHLRKIHGAFRSVVGEQWVAFVARCHVRSADWTYSQVSLDFFLLLLAVRQELLVVAKHILKHAVLQLLVRVGLH